MKFYDRKNELKNIQEIHNESKNTAKLTVLTGRRRVGKTSLILKAFEKESFLYFFIAKKSESLLCEEFIEQIKEKLKVPVFGNITKFPDLFSFLMEIAKNNHFTLVIDEFQEWNSINSSVFSEMQKNWDLNKQNSKINLIVMGSVYSLMKKIFENSKEPLFGRANERIFLKPFDVEVLKNLFNEYTNSFTPKDLLAFYVFTGGIPKYVELFIDKKALTYDKMLNEIFRDNSYFISEGKNVLIEEFGKEYSTYFSILSLIASSKTSRVEIESILEKNIGGYLDKLENEYNIIKRIKPIFSKPNSKSVKYFIEDNFLNFWFRFIYKYRSTVEIGNLDYIKQIVERDFDVFSGKFLEKYFVEKLKLSKQYSLIGNYWEKGNKNEIDIIAVNDLEKKILFAEVKINKDKISIEKLKEKSKKLLLKFKEYEIEYKGFSIEDM